MAVIIYYIFFAITLLHTIYFGITGLFAFLKNKTKVVKCENKTKFAILIAARNEERVIGNLVESLIKQDYPSDLYDIYTCVNNCTDDTLEVAKKAKSKIIEVKAKVKTKGEVLLYALDKLKEQPYDAYIVFDADNVVDSKFLTIMNNYYQSGYKFVQGRKDSSNISASWISSSYSLFYYMQNIFYNKARTRSNMCATINGTGFMVDKKFMEEKFKPVTITEDIELSLICVLNGERIVYADEAITYDEQPLKFKVSWKQRARWSFGIMQCCKRYSKQLLSNYFEEGDFSNFDKVMFLIAPYMQILSFVLMAALLVFKLLGIELYDIFSYFFNLGMWCFLISYLLCALFSALVIKYYDNSVIKNLHGIFLFSIFIITWIPINIVCMFKNNVTWTPIEHGQNLVKSKN